jgi:hypothetical protein
MINTTIAAADDQLVSAAVIDRPDLNREPVAAEAAWDDGPTVELSGGPRRNQRGMVSAEWAVGIIAAIAIAGVLLTIVTSGPVRAALLKVILMIIGMFTQNAHFLKL